MRSARLARRLTLAWAAVIFVLSVLPTHAVLSSTVGDGETLATQAGHFVEFAVLAALAASWLTARGEDAAAPRPAKIWWSVLVAAVCYGAVIEVVQIPLTYRSAQLSDLVADAAGALAGLLLVSCGLGLRARAVRRRAR